MANQWRRISQIVFFLLFIWLLLQTEYKGSDQLGLPVRIFLDFDPLIVLTAMTGVAGFLVYFTVAVLLVLGALAVTGRLLKKSNKERPLLRMLPWIMGTSLLLISFIPYVLGGSIPFPMLFAFVTIGVTMIMGRLFCGWVCPFGATLQFVSYLNKEKRKVRIAKNEYKASQRWKYYGLFGLVVAAVFGLQLIGVFDPISLSVRGFGLVVNPVVNQVANSSFESLIFADVPVVSDAARSVYDLIAFPNFLSFAQPAFNGIGWIALFFFGIMALNLIRPRFWCRVLCPLGAMLGMISGRAPYRLHREQTLCHGCGACSLNCQGACDPEFKEGWVQNECFVCYYCVDSCPSAALSFKFSKPKPALSPRRDIDLSKRKSLAAVAGAALAVPLLASDGQRKQDVGGASEGPAITNPELIRPPGALEESKFLNACIRCGECMKVCPTNGLQPAALESGIEGLWTPVLVPQIGYCEYNCNLCGQVCPTGAILELTVPEKKKTSIGTAFFDVDKCLPYAFSIDCIVCEEHCPTTPKAIWFETVDRFSREEVVEDTGFGEPAADPYGSDSQEEGSGESDGLLEFTGDPAESGYGYGGESYGGDQLKRPRIDPKLCIGCGICEKVCVVADRPAVRVTAVGESRSSTNQMLLGGGGY